MRGLELIVGAIMIGVFAVMIISTAGLVYWQAQTPGPAFAPFWVAVVGIGLCLLMAGESWSTQKARSVAWPSRPGAIRLVLIAISLWAVIFLAPIVGFVAAAGLFCLVFTTVIMQSPWIPGLVTTFIVVALLKFVFVMSLDVELPVGAIGF